MDLFLGLQAFLVSFFLVYELNGVENNGNFNDEHNLRFKVNIFTFYRQN